MPRFRRKHRPSNDEGTGNAGCLMHPQPRVQWKKAHELVTTGPPKHSGIPCAMAYDLFRVLPGETGLCCHRRLSEDSRGLAPASGRRDHTASPSAKEGRSSCDTLRVHRIPPRVRDDASAPPTESGWRDVSIISEKKKEKYFQLQVWTTRLRTYRGSCVSAV